jgi:hypothetical protein
MPALAREARDVGDAQYRRVEAASRFAIWFRRNARCVTAGAGIRRARSRTRTSADLTAGAASLPDPVAAVTSMRPARRA